MSLRPTLTRAALAKDTRSGWRRDIDNLHHNGMWPFVETRPRVMYSPACLVDMAARHRIVDLASDPCSTGELAGVYLKAALKAHNAARIGYRRDAWEHVAKLKVPSHWAGQGPLSGSWAIVDLNHAYLSILNQAALNMHVRFDRHDIYLGAGHLTLPRGDELDNDIGRALVGRVSRREVIWYRYGEPQRQLAPITRLAPDLFAWIKLVLTAISWDMIRYFGAVAIATDAYTIPDDQADGATFWLASEWGLGSKIKDRGPGIIFGQASYDLWGSGQTGDLRRREQYLRIAHQARSNLFPLTVDMCTRIRETRMCFAQRQAKRGAPALRLDA